MANDMQSPVKAVFNFPATDDYSEVEEQKLEEFRKKVLDILETEDHKDNSFLIRWLRAKNLDLTKAEKMLRASMKWRKENDIDTILERQDVPDDIKESAPIAFCGISKEGYATLVCPFGRHDARNGLEKYGLEECLRFQLVNVETMMQRLRIEGRQQGRKITQVIEIMDCEGFSYMQMFSKVCREFMTKMQQLLDNHYPEVIRYAMVVNAPKVFAVLFALMKSFVPKSSSDRMDVYGPEPEKWKAAVRERFPVDQIPPHWGGTMEGVDEYCSGHEMWMQGPKDMRAFMQGLSEADADFHKTIVNARDKFVKSFEVSAKNTILEWKFKTDNYDIGFQLTIVPSSINHKIGRNVDSRSSQNAAISSVIDIVPVARVDAQQSVQKGSHVCEIPGKYSFVFDNSFSMLRAKTLFYQIDII